MPEITPSRYLVNAGWDDVPHLSEKAKTELLGQGMPHTKDARSKGIPSLGAGAVYPIVESEFLIDPFPIPAHWPRAYGLDVGWNRTAVIWGAWDPSVDILYLFSEYYRGRAEPSTHATAIKSRGEWIPGVVDPASRGRSQKDGEALFDNYRDLGLDITSAANPRESGLYQVWTRLETSRLRVFSTLQNWRAEFRLYRRDEKGVIVKENDHLMDGTRYLVMSGRPVAQPVPTAVLMAGSNVADNIVGY